MKPFRDGFHVNGIAFGRSKDGNRGLKTGFEPFGDGFELFQKGSNDPGKGSNASKEGSNDPGKGWNDPGKGWNDPGKGWNDPGKGSNASRKSWNDPGKGSNEWRGGSNDFRQRSNNARTGYSPPFGSESNQRPLTAMAVARPRAYATSVSARRATIAGRTKPRSASRARIARALSCAPTVTVSSVSAGATGAS